VHPDHLVVPPEIKPTAPITPEHPGDHVHYPPAEKPGDKTGRINEAEPQKKVLSRYYGRVEIDAQRIHKDIGVIVEEVIERLTSQVGCEVEVTLEIHAKRPEGFDEGIVRTISENSRTLKFEHFDFEEG
jgi:hypothetical protein